MNSWKLNHVRDAGQQKSVGTHPKNSQQLQNHNLKQLQTPFNTKHEKGVFPPHYTLNHVL